MSNGLYNLLSVIVASISAIIGFIIYHLSKRDQIKLQNKELLEQMKLQERENRKQVLIDLIKDEKIPLSTREKAADEYLSYGYNGVIKDYINQNNLKK
jgi:hypothetical protein